MKHALCLMLLSLTVLTGCGSAHSEPLSVSSPWSEAPAAEAAPYVRTENPAPVTQQRIRTQEEIDRELCTDRGSFYSKNRELELVDALPQDEPCSFSPHPDQWFAKGERSEAEYIELAAQFADAGFDARVNKLQQVLNGEELTRYLVVITATPAELWELAEDWPERVYMELLDSEVLLRYDIPVWPEQ